MQPALADSLEDDKERVVQGARVDAFEVVTATQQGLADGQGEVRVDAALDEKKEVDGLVNVDQLVVVVQDGHGADVVCDEEVDDVLDGRAKTHVTEVGGGADAQVAQRLEEEACFSAVHANELQDPILREHGNDNLPHRLLVPVNQRYPAGGGVDHLHAGIVERAGRVDGAGVERRGAGHRADVCQAVERQGVGQVCGLVRPGAGVVHDVQEVRRREKPGELRRLGVPERRRHNRVLQEHVQRTLHQERRVKDNEPVRHREHVKGRLRLEKLPNHVQRRPLVGHDRRS